MLRGLGYDGGMSDDGKKYDRKEFMALFMKPIKLGIAGAAVGGTVRLLSSKQSDSPETIAKNVKEGALVGGVAGLGIAAVTSRDGAAERRQRRKTYDDGVNMEYWQRRHRDAHKEDDRDRGER